METGQLSWANKTLHMKKVSKRERLPEVKHQMSITEIKFKREEKAPERCSRREKGLKIRDKKTLDIALPL